MYTIYCIYCNNMYILYIYIQYTHIYTIYIQYSTITLWWQQRQWLAHLSHLQSPGEFPMCWQLLISGEFTLSSKHILQHHLSWTARELGGVYLPLEATSAVRNESPWMVRQALDPKTRQFWDGFNTVLRVLLVELSSHHCPDPLPGHKHTHPASGFFLTHLLYLGSTCPKAYLYSSSCNEVWFQASPI